MIRRNTWTFRLLLVSLAVVLSLLALQPILRIAVLHNSHSLFGSRWTIGRFDSSLRHAKIAMGHVKALSTEQGKAPLFEADQIVLDVNCRAMAGGQVLIPRAFVNGLNLPLPRIPSYSPASSPGSEASNAKGELDKNLLTWLSVAKQELNASTTGNYTAVQLAQNVIQKWGTSLEETEQRAVAAREQRRELLHAIDRVGENPLRNSVFYHETIAAIDQLDSEIFEVRGEVERWRQQADMDREAIRNAVQVDLASAVQPIATPDPQKITKYLLEADVAQRVHTAVTWLSWGRQFLPTYYRPDATSAGRGRHIVFDGLTARPDVLIESIALRGCGGSSDATYQIEGAISNLSSHPQRNEFPTEIVLNTLGQAQSVLHVTLDARQGQLIERITVTSPRCEIAERKLGRPDLLAITASAGICHYGLTIEQRDGRLAGELKLRQPAIVLAPCFTHLLDSPQVAAVVTDAIRAVETLEVEAKLSGTWEHPQWSLQSNLGTELAEQLAQQLYARRLAVHRAELDRAMLALEAQLNVRYEICNGRCDRIAATLSSENGALAQLRATIATRADDGPTNR